MTESSLKEDYLLLLFIGFELFVKAVSSKYYSLWLLLQPVGINRAGSRAPIAETKFWKRFSLNNLHAGWQIPEVMGHTARKRHKSLDRHIDRVAEIQMDTRAVKTLPADSGQSQSRPPAFSLPERVDGASPHNKSSQTLRALISRQKRTPDLRRTRFPSSTVSF